MRKLSNADLRKLYTMRAMLNQIVQTVALQARGGNLNDSWERELSRMQALHRAIRDIVQDPQFEVMVPRPEMSQPTSYTHSPGGTLLNVATTARELSTYLDGVLPLYDTPKSKQLESAPTAKPKVFVGHGRNEVVRQRVKDFIQDSCGLETIILQELPSSGMTVIEKLEKYGRLADYAILVLTADDFSKEGLARARQNVIQELGWFQGVLGRNRTAILAQVGIEIPSNVAGVVRLEFQGDDVESIFQALHGEFLEAGLTKPGTGALGARQPSERPSSRQSKSSLA